MKSSWLGLHGVVVISISQINSFPLKTYFRIGEQILIYPKLEAKKSFSDQDIESLLNYDNALMLKVYKGNPSLPGWKKGEFERLTNWATSDEANRPIIGEYEPSAWWLWSKWDGTVFSMIWQQVLFAMLLACGLDVAVHYFSSSTWSIFSIPPEENPIIIQLKGVNQLWEFQLTLSTFILSFFTQETYRHWKSVYFCTRAIQGRINDICLLVTIGAARGTCTEFGCNVATEMNKNIEKGVTSGYSSESAKLVNLCSRLIRLSHTFFWAATPTGSNGISDLGYSLDEERKILNIPADQWNENTIGPMLLSEEGLEILVQAGELTPGEKTALHGSALPPSQYTYILLEWVGLHIMDGFRSGSLSGESGLEENLLRQICALRAEYFNIGDLSAGRMPVAYVHLVQILIDSLVFLSPFALYPQIGSLTVILSGILTVFFKGLLELSKSFLDPFGTEGFPGQNIRVDVLVSELNFGAGSRWVHAGESLPYPTDENI